MIHGIIFAKRATRLDTDPDNAFENEVRSFFGSGTQVQELYLSPELLNARNWDDLASAARWARANANILHDTHWIGGDPAKREPYGWAAWSPVKGIITLRNPSDHSTAFTFEAGAAFELPTGAAKRFRVASAYPDSSAPFAELCAGVPISITMQPFEVLVLEATPTGP
jgi:hypothetical protein